ncbi:carnitine acetyl transferas-like protein [Westerdykella ornata]|uniref:Carnitine acetyl transferas-like protein n=1 Tax=Westerdykella ornata TaxID=318751 RepID=A0A6A6JUN4_WESOR|nr:carnitine acetyl transferas-like protein [Westerdykella ornata]KAF2280330.1 carnitine acetyl transferas-like protein [Westerdykella ornata]
MAARTFSTPSSLNESLATAAAMTGSEADSAARSVASARDSTQSFPSEAKDPLKYSGANDSKPGITFAHEGKLPRLPIPELESTCNKYLAALKPLQSPREHNETVVAVNEFLKHDGPALQEKLKKYAADKGNYIEQFWYDSYLNFDNPVVLNLNPFFLLEDDPTPARNNQVNRAASLVVSALSFVRAVRREELPPDTVRGTPLCMYQYSRLFGTARIPTEHGCQIGQDPTSKHIVVLCEGQFYWFDVLDDNSDLIMTEKDIALNLQVIIEDAETIPIQDAAKSSLGVLTTENRKVWSGLRDLLHREEGSNNSDCLNIVDSALFVLCLDYTEPQTEADLCMNMLCGTSKIERGVQVGTCTNRWYDKLQIIVCKNGSAGINFEHTGVDGHTVLRFASDLYTDTILRFAKTINGGAPSLWATSSPDPAKRDPDSFGEVQTTPHKLEWDMIPELVTALRFAETRLADLIQQNEFATLDFSAYGKNFMTSMGFSPDAFVQMAFQAAYYGLYGRMECVYEPAMTKFFHHGRTEAIRSVTEESVEFVKTFWGDNPPGQKVEALRKACQKHTENTKVSAKAQGCDRHLYALYCIWQRAIDQVTHDMESTDGYDSTRTSSSDASAKRTGTFHRDSIVSESGSVMSATAAVQHTMPALFADSGWDKLNTTILSTSNCGNPSLRQFGFGPTAADGFGIGYIIKDGSISICASSKHRQTGRFIDALEAYLLEMRRLLRLVKRRGTSVDKNATRARELENRPKPTRMKSRGRLVVTDGKPSAPIPDDVTESDDDGLGGCRAPPSPPLDVKQVAKITLSSALPPTPPSSPPFTPLTTVHMSSLRLHTPVRHVHVEKRSNTVVKKVYFTC